MYMLIVIISLFVLAIVSPLLFPNRLTSRHDKDQQRP